MSIDNTRIEDCIECFVYSQQVAFGIEERVLKRLPSVNTRR